MKIYYHQGCNDIGVVIATKWRFYLFYLKQYFSALGTVLPKSFTGAFSSDSPLDVRGVKAKFVRALSRYFRIKFFMVRNTVKNGQSWCSAFLCRKRRAFGLQFHLIVGSIFLKTYVKDHRLLVRIQALLLAVCKHFGLL